MNIKYTYNFPFSYPPIVIFSILQWNFIFQYLNRIITPVIRMKFKWSLLIMNSRERENISIIKYRKYGIKWESIVNEPNGITTILLFSKYEQYFYNPFEKKEKKISTLIIKCDTSECFVFSIVNFPPFAGTGDDYLDRGVVIIKATLTRIHSSVR